MNSVGQKSTSLFQHLCLFVRLSGIHTSEFHCFDYNLDQNKHLTTTQKTRLKFYLSAVVRLMDVAQLSICPHFVLKKICAKDFNGSEQKLALTWF